MDDYIRSAMLLAALLNPFFMSIYLIHLIKDLDLKTFLSVMTRAAVISTFVFIAFAYGGEAIFTDWLQVSFSSFQIFGGLIFGIVGVRFVFHGPESVQMLRGKAQYLAGSIAMPFMIGPGTVSASVVIGSKHTLFISSAIILSAMVFTVITVSFLKYIHDQVKERNEKLVERYIDIVGRISALLIGTIAIDMVLRGLKAWITTI